MANSDLHSTFFLGVTAHLTSNTVIKIIWKNNEPIWTEQWPLMKEKLQTAKELTDTQLELKHIAESCSPWNSPIFVIKKKSNKWSLLTDVLEKEMATHSSILAWKIPWTEDPGRVQSMGSQRVRHDRVTSLHFTFNRR